MSASQCQLATTHDRVYHRRIIGAVQSQSQHRSISQKRLGGLNTPTTSSDTRSSATVLVIVSIHLQIGQPSRSRGTDGSGWSHRVGQDCTPRAIDRSRHVIRYVTKRAMNSTGKAATRRQCKTCR
eukprot:422605-Rhodomonas_salina.2